MYIPFMSVSYKVLSISLNLGQSFYNLIQLLCRLILQIIMPTQSGSYICYSMLVYVVPSGLIQWPILSILFYPIYIGFLMSSLILV